MLFVWGYRGFSRTFFFFVWGKGSPAQKRERAPLFPMAAGSLRVWSAGLICLLVWRAANIYSGLCAISNRTAVYPEWSQLPSGARVSFLGSVRSLLNSTNREQGALCLPWPLNVPKVGRLCMFRSLRHHLPALRRLPLRGRSGWTIRSIIRREIELGSNPLIPGARIAFRAWFGWILHPDGGRNGGGVFLLFSGIPFLEWCLKGNHEGNQTVLGDPLFKTQCVTELSGTWPPGLVAATGSHVRGPTRSSPKERTLASQIFSGQGREIPERCMIGHICLVDLLLCACIDLFALHACFSSQLWGVRL